MSTGHIPVSLQRRVRLRASERCEYCRIAQVGQEATFHAWSDHFMADVSGEILGLTAIGRATVMSLSMNRVLAVAIRHEERTRDRWP